MSEKVELWQFKNVETGEIISVKAPTQELAWKELEKDYSDPLHAWQEWAPIDE